MKIKYLVILILSFFEVIVLSQNEEKSFVSGNLYNVTFDELVSLIELQTSCKVFYDTAQTKDIIVNMLLSNMPVEKVIRKAVENSDLTYTIIKESIYIYMGTPILTDFTLKMDTTDAVKLPIQDKSEINTQNKFSKKLQAEVVEKIVIGSKIDNANKMVTVTGRLQKKETGEPLDGVTVYFETTGKGAITDHRGAVTFNLLPGKYRIILNHIGVEEKKVDLDVRNSGIFFVELDKKLISIKEVTVVTSLNRQLNSLNTGFENMAYGDLKEVPPMLGERDILKAVQMLPGVLNAGEGTTGLYIRGGTADQNHVYFNHIPIYNTSHLFGFFSSFNGEIINDVNMYKSHIPANYGGRISSILELNSKIGNRKNFKMRGGISPISTNVVAELPIKKERGSLIASYRTSYTDYLLSRVESPIYKKSSGGFYDFVLSGNYSLAETSTLNATFYASSDQFNLGEVSEYVYSNRGYSIVWEKLISAKVKSEVLVTQSKYNYEFISKENKSFGFKNNYAINHSEVKTQLMLNTSEKHSLNMGLGAVYYKIDRGDILPIENSVLSPLKLQNEQALEGAIFFSDQYRVSEKLKLYLGLRYVLYAHLGPQSVNMYATGMPQSVESVEKVVEFAQNEPTKYYNSPEIRFSLNYRMNINNALKFSFDQNRQYLYMVTNTNAISPQDQWKLSDYNLKPASGNQISIGYYRTVNYPSLSVSLEIYGKNMKNVLQYKDGAELISQPNIETEVLQGEQKSYGAELLIKKDKGNLSGWIAYAYSRSFMQVDDTYGWNRINNGKRYPTDYDKPHSLNIFTSIRANRRISLSSTIVYSTGRPITYPKAYYYVNSIPVFDYSDRNSGRIPDYFRLDAALNFEGNLRRNKFIHSWWSIGVYNLTGRKNAYSVFFRSDEKGFSGNKLSIIGVPVLSVTWNFKLGNYEN